MFITKHKNEVNILGHHPCYPHCCIHPYVLLPHLMPYCPSRGNHHAEFSVHDAPA